MDVCPGRRGVGLFTRYVVIMRRFRFLNGVYWHSQPLGASELERGRRSGIEGTPGSNASWGEGRSGRTAVCGRCCLRMDLMIAKSRT